jgi:hypothetical protein
MVWLVAALACGFDSSGGGDDSAGSLGEPTSTSGGPTLTTTAGTTGTISEATEGSTEADAGATVTAESTAADEGPTTDTEGPSLELDDEGVIVRYYLDEANDGNAPTHALDDIIPRLDLPHDWQETVSYAVDASGNRGLRWSRAEEDGGPRITVEGTKVRDRLEGKTTATIEFVANVRGVAEAGGSRFVAICHGDADVRLGLLSEDPHQVWFRWRNGKNAAFWDVDLFNLGRAVFHVVLDTTGDEDDRVRLYINGMKLPVIKGGGDWPTAGQPIDFHNSSELVLGNRPPGERSFEGVLYYAALYDVAFAENRIAHHVAVLSKSDDRP